MKISRLIVIWLLAIFLVPVSLKAQHADVIAAATGAVEALNQQDAETYMSYLHPNFTRFLHQSPTLLKDNDAQSMREGFERGMRFDMQLSDLEVAFYGQTAVVTGYETGTAKFPDGRVIDGKRKYTSVWVKEDRAWKEVHLHISMAEE